MNNIFTYYKELIISNPYYEHFLDDDTAIRWSFDSGIAILILFTLMYIAIGNHRNN